MADKIPEGKIPPEFTGITVMLYTSGGRWYMSMTALRRTAQDERETDWHATFRLILPFKQSTDTYRQLLEELATRVTDAAWDIPESVVLT